MKDLVFIGAGGHAVDITKIVRDINTQDIVNGGKGVWNILGYLSDEEEYFNNKYEILGPISSIEMIAKLKGAVYYVIAINNSQTRKKIWEEYLDDKDGLFGASLIHPSSDVGTHRWGADTVVGPLVTVSGLVDLGKGIHINSGVTINQSAILGSFCTLSPGVNVCGDVTIGDCVQFGAGGVVINYMTIGNNVTVGSGSVIISDVPDNTTVVGVPAKPIKNNGLIVWG